MMIWNTYALLFFCLIHLSNGVIYKLTDEEYRRMPPVFHLDPYESCMQSPHAVYCTAYLTFVSDEPSQLLTQMQEYTEHRTTHFNHTEGLYGTCMTDTCASFNNTRDITLSLEACRNKTIYEEYKLRVKVRDVSCLGTEYDQMRIGTAHIAMAAICLALVVFNIIGSMYDAFCKEKHGPASQLILCFSLRRNWLKLVAVPGEQDARQKKFKSFYGIRAILMTLVIGAHSMLPSVVLSEDSKFYEELYGHTWLHILLNGSVIMQTFLQMSAILLVYNMQLICEDRKLTWKMLPWGLFMRWLRLTPAYGLVLGLTVTWLPITGTGPLWDKIVTIEARDCHKDWWAHLLYINNYFDNSQCMPQAWYLATDTQLYALGMLVFVFCKTTISRKIVLSILFLVGLVLPGLHTYFQDLDGTLVSSPTAAVGFFVADPTFNNTYKRGHTNIACYVLGLAFGYLLYHLQNTNLDITKYKRWRPVYWAMLPLAVGVIMLSKLNYVDGPRMGLGYRVAMSCLIKPAFGLATLVIFWGMIFKLENLYRGILEWRGWSCLGRVSYSAYLLHMALIRTAAGLRTTVLGASHLDAFQVILFMIVATYTAAYIFYLTVESPLGELMKTILGQKKPDKNRENCEEKRDCHSKL